jgi:hypothetical protein
VYFYFAGPVHYAGIAGRLPHWPVVGNVQPTPTDAGSTSEGLIGLQYWFFYPYNYYPLVVRSQLMNRAPLAGDIQNVDLHQGDWEHGTKYVNVAGPRSPLWQAENGSVNHFGVCDRGAAAAENDALHGALAALLARQPAR